MVGLKTKSFEKVVFSRTLLKPKKIERPIGGVRKDKIAGRLKKIRSNLFLFFV